MTEQRNRWELLEALIAEYRLTYGLDYTEAVKQIRRDALTLDKRDKGSDIYIGI